MKKKQFFAVLSVVLGLCPMMTGCASFEDMFFDRIGKDRPFLGYSYKNIKWTNHRPVMSKDEAGKRSVGGHGQIDTGIVDLDGDKKEETIKVIWGAGVSDHSLTIEIIKEGKVISTLRNEFGLQPNFRVTDADQNGKKEIILWSGVWDSRLPGDEGVTEATCEGLGDPHRNVVATYKLLSGKFRLWDIYTTNKKFMPFCEKQPKD